MSWLKHFEENGYAVVEDVFSEDELAEMKAEIERVIDGVDLDQHPKSVFSTYDEDKVRPAVSTVLRQIHRVVVAYRRRLLPQQLW